jgi:hypothetical protein
MTIQVNDTDYDGRIVIERDGSVPAWEEMGMGSLEGDQPETTEHAGVKYVIGYSWSSRARAEAALREYIHP